ncbi:MAG: single-stranded DNA-binding protein [Ginsengibacter sp.]
MKTNHVTLIGYVGSHLLSTKIANGSKRVAIRMATHYSQKNHSGEKISQTVWHDVVAWNKVAEYAEKSVVKGSRILVEGSIIYRTYPDNAGHIRYVTLISAESLMNLDR